MCRAPGPVDAVLRYTAALAGTLPVAVLASVVIARLAPLPDTAQFAAGAALAIPIWVALISWASLARRGVRAWAACLAAAAVLAALAYGL